METNNTSIFNRDRLWIRIKKYLYYIIILLSLLVFLLIYLVYLVTLNIQLTSLVHTLGQGT